MPYINLIAEQRARSRDRARKARMVLFTFVGAATISLVSVGYLVIRCEAIAAEIRSLEAQALALKPIKDSIEQNQNQLASLRPRLLTLSTAQKDTERWSRILDHLSLVMPENTWLTQVTAVGSSDVSKPIEVSWTGLSREQNLVGELMLRMQRSTDFGNVNLKYTETKTNSFGRGIEFQISTDVVGTEELKVPNQKEALRS
jgi:Tfp pilus assembly protein PilN